MRKEELDKIYEYLEKEANKQGLFYFQFESGNINVKFKSDNHTFAQFYPKQILNIINGVYDKTGITGDKPKKIKKLDIIREKNINNNWKWKIKTDTNDYNISTPQMIIANKLNEIIDYLNNMEE